MRTKQSTSLPTRWTLYDWVTGEVCMYSMAGLWGAFLLLARFGSDVCYVIPDPWAHMQRRNGAGPLLLTEANTPSPIALTIVPK